MAKTNLNKQLHKPKYTIISGCLWNTKFQQVNKKPVKFLTNEQLACVISSQATISGGSE